MSIGIARIVTLPERREIASAGFTTLTLGAQWEWARQVVADHAGCEPDDVNCTDDGVTVRGVLSFALQFC